MNDLLRGRVSRFSLGRTRKYLDRAGLPRADRSGSRLNEDKGGFILPEEPEILPHPPVPFRRALGKVGCAPFAGLIRPVDAVSDAGAVCDQVGAFRGCGGRWLAGARNLAFIRAPSLGRPRSSKVTIPTVTPSRQSLIPLPRNDFHVNSRRLYAPGIMLHAIFPTGGVTDSGAADMPHAPEILDIRINHSRVYLRCPCPLVLGQ
jgi:hypothetical protein